MLWSNWQCHRGHIMPIVSHDQRSNITHCFDHLDLRNVVVPLKGYKLDVLKPLVSHSERSHVVPLFNCLDLMNAMMHLMMLLASCYTDASTNGIITLWESHVALHFSLLDSWNASQLISHNANTSASGVTWPKSYRTWFWSSWLRNAMGSLKILSASHDVDTNANGIIWCWCQR